MADQENIKKSIKKNKELCKRYPFILPKNVWTGELDPEYDYSFTLWDELGPGWSEAFGDIYLEELGEELKRTNFFDYFFILQIKEKYGSLRVYSNGAPSSVHDLINKYESISSHVCYYCGELDVPILDVFGWYLPICKHCYETQVEQIRKRYGKDFHWHAPTYERLIEQAYNENERDFTIPDHFEILGSKVNDKGEYESYTKTIPFGDTVNKIRAKAAAKKEKNNESDN